jgi:hypothetical protein
VTSPPGEADRPDLPAGTGLALVVLAALVVFSVIGERSGGEGGEPVAASLVALSPLDGRSPREPAGRTQRVLVELPRPALADRDDLDSLTPEQQRDYVRSLERESAALRSALGARGVALRDAVTFGRTWDGFAATIDTSDLAALSSLGVRAQPVRRFYPATSEPVPVRADLPKPRAAPPASQAPIAVLDTGAEGAEGAAPGFDALDGDADPAPGSDPRAPRRRESTGTALAGIVAAAGERVLSVRVAGYGGAAAPEIHGTTDALLLGLERAVDPDGDGAADDAVRVALVGVNAPYAGFGDSPEAQAARGAAKLGTLVVAPAGNEGPARPPNGVVGSPGAARSALAAGATEAGAGAARVEVTIGERKLQRAAVLGGTPPAGAPLAGPVDATDAEALLASGPRLTDRIALVRAGANPVAQATAAASAGASAVLLAEPRKRVLPLMPAGRVAAPVVGLTGDAAKAALEAKRGAAVKFGRVSLERPRSGGGAASGGSSGGTATGRAAAGPAPFSSRGPAFDGTPKPDVVAPGAAVAPLPGGGAALVAGTAVAAARVAVQAARLARARPAETAAGVREALVPAASAEASGAAPAPPVPLGALRLTRRDGKVAGVRFTLGAFDRGDPLAGGARLEPASRLELALVDGDGAVQRRLTAPGGAHDLLPAEYAYTLPPKALKRLGAGTYRFRATARAPRSERSSTRRSPAFTEGP